MWYWDIECDGDWVGPCSSVEQAQADVQDELPTAPAIEWEKWSNRLYVGVIDGHVVARIATEDRKNELQQAARERRTTEVK